MNAFTKATSVPWAITTEALENILAIAARENDSIEAVEQRLGRPLENSHTVTTRDGVASIPVDGPIFRKANLFTQISGATSIETLAQDFRQALDDPAIRGIVLNIDSPGGEVAGVAEFADMIHDARGKKPIIAYIDDYGASAAYWIASAADEVMSAATAHVGSIGVVAAVRDPTTQSSRSLEFVSSQSPNKRIDPTTPGGKSQIQTIVDELADVFVAAVARNRGVSTDTVLSDFGQGGVFIGQSAVKAGLVDKLGSHEQALARARERPATPVPMRHAAGANPPAAQGGSRPPTTQRKEGTVSMSSKLGKFFSIGRAGRDLVREAGGDPGDEDLHRILEDEAREAREQARQEEQVKLEAKNVEVERKLAAANDALFKANAQRLTGEAYAFADGLVAGNKILPIERDDLAALYTQAGMDDMQRGAIISATGKETSRLEQLKAREAARPAHILTSEQIAVDKDGKVIHGRQPGQEASDVLTEEEKDKLLALTTVGRAALALKQKGRAN